MDEGWIAWSGGECPVEPETLVRIKLRGGYYRPPTKAENFRWTYLDEIPDYDIIAYKVERQNHAR
jgi:hypothetical protein